MPSTGGASTLIERDVELAALGAALDDVIAGAGRVVLIEGPPGIGKTRLWEATREQARGRGLRVLSAVCDELVERAPFGVVRDLLGSLAADPANPVDPTIGLAAPVFDRTGSALREPTTAASAVHGLYGLIARAAAREPLALFVDDVQWIDPASARLVAYLARRVSSLPVALVLTLRAGEAHRTLDALIGPSIVRLRPRALTAEATWTLVRDRLGPTADEALCRRYHAASAGNPFLILELLAVGWRPDAPSTVSPGPTDQPSSDLAAIAGHVTARLRSLGPRCERLAEALVVLGPGAPIRHAAALAGLDRASTAEAADRLATAGLVVPGAELSFEHPIVTEALAAAMGRARLAELHHTAARRLADEAAPADRVAAHLLASDPYGEAWVVDALRDGAHLALSRGAPETAVTYLQRALAEPPADRLEVLVELGRAEAMTPGATEFTALEQALTLADDPVTAGEIALELGLACFGVVHSAAGVEVLERALEDAARLPEDLAWRLEASLIGGGIVDLPAAPRLLARVRARLGTNLAGEIADGEMLSALALAGVAGGFAAAPAAQLAQRALADPRLLTDRLHDGYVSAALTLILCERLDEAIAALEVGITQARRRGWAAMEMQLALLRGDAALRAGRPACAEEHGERASALADELGATEFSAAFIAPILFERDRTEAVGEIVARHLSPRTAIDSWPRLLLLVARGRLGVCGDRVSDGFADLMTAHRLAEAAGLDLSVLVDWVIWAVRGAIALARPADAAALAAREHAAAQTFGAPRRTGLALLARGLAGGGPDAAAALADAETALASAGATVEQARALTALGAAQRDNGQIAQARATFGRAGDLADRVGATAIERCAIREARATGARPRRTALSGPEALTPAERRTARLAAEGLTNRQIAERLTLTTKTIETQLSQTYAKLAIRGRAELAAALAGKSQGRP